MQSEGGAACVGLCSSQECVGVLVCVHTPGGPSQSCSGAALCLKFSLQQTVCDVEIQTSLWVHSSHACRPRMRIRPGLCSTISPFGRTAAGNAPSACGKVTAQLWRAAGSSAHRIFSARIFLFQF